MRLWSISPFYLDTKGLVALWREALLAKAVLEGKTKGYKHHPQLDRFKATNDPVAEINEYLFQVYCEAEGRGYKFDASKLLPTPSSFTESPLIKVTEGQVRFELTHLYNKIKDRSPGFHRIKIIEDTLMADRGYMLHTSFKMVPGNIESWEKL